METKERKEKLIAISTMIFYYAEQLKETPEENLVNSPIVDSIIIACLKHKHASGVGPKEALSIISKLTQ